MTIDDLLKEFCIYKKDIEGRSDSSMNLYIKNIKEFCNAMEINDYNTLINTQAETIKKWVIELADKGNGATTRNNKLTSIKQLFLFLEDEKDIQVDRHINKIKFAKTPIKENKYATREIMEQLIAETTNQLVKAGIVIICTTGVRFSELLQITCSDIEKGSATIVGKGNKERTIYFSPECINISKKFINNKRKKIVESKNIDSDLLFISKDGTLISQQSFAESLKHYAKKIGLYWYDEMSPHKLRHGFATNKINEGYPLQVVRDALGHSSISTTNRYVHSNDEDVKNMMIQELWEER